MTARASVTDHGALSLPSADLERICDAEAKRTRRGWRLRESYRATWRNYHPVLNR